MYHSVHDRGCNINLKLVSHTHTRVHTQLQRHKVCHKYTQMGRDGTEDTLQPLRQLLGPCLYEQPLKMQLSGETARRLRTGGTRHLLMKECFSVERARSERESGYDNSAKSCNLAWYYTQSSVSLSFCKRPYSAQSRYFMGHEETPQSAVLWFPLSTEGRNSWNSVPSARR